MEAMPKYTMEKNHKEKRKQTQNEVQREVEKSLQMIQFQIQQEKKTPNIRQMSLAYTYAYVSKLS